MALFPNFDSPDDIRRGKLAATMYPTLPSTAPASAPDPVVVQKTKGSFGRRELVTIQNESDKKPLTWNGHNFYQLVKGPALQRQQFYPTPPLSLDPNHAERPPDLTVCPRTANALYNLKKTHLQTVYGTQYTGNGPQNVLRLDNYDDACRGHAHELKEYFKNEFTPPHPLEGRHSEIRKPVKQKKRKRIIVGDGTELWVTDDEDDDLHTQYKVQESAVQAQNTYAEDTKQPVVEREPGTYSKNVHHLINHENSEFEQDLRHVPGTYYPSAHPYQAKSLLQFDKSSSSYKPTTRPATAPEIPRPRSPTIHNMPSQVPEETKTGSTNSDLYPKWFRKSSVYGPRRPSTALIELQNSWSRTEAHRKFHQEFPENAPDIRQKPDLRITTNERRHVIPETGVHVFYYHR
ncbi:predicted protein [Nematostella vectensis]|uniref:Uncharacterized protein n=2 Tax=Nematostella vectensis TaxID=45351 RepID=A7S4H3_NEMVE|nr:predicted protein [Nematostella vectensis]|eukprot:XP_001633455.1 predicted protein [Nematostella vectensis]